MWVPVAGLPSLLALSALTRGGRFCILRFGAARRKDVLAGNRRGLSDIHPQLLSNVGFGKSSSRVYRCRSEIKRYITSPRLAETLVQILQGKGDASQPILECNPGPGILTQALLGSGAKVIALESDKTFIPQLESLGKNLGGKLEVVYCDFFKLDPRSRGIVTPPVMTSEMLFQNLGIEALSWSKGDFCYLKLLANPRTPNLYQALSVLCQIACGIKVLNKELVEQNMCLIQLTPHRDLFTGNLTPFNYDVFFHMLRQCFMKRNAKLVDHLHSLSPIDALHILKQIKKNKNVKVIDMYPQDFHRLFETIECSKEDTCKWLYDDFMEDVIL
ncbi:Dimethyladenosine transferase 2; mitochondrial [Camelus dromedarius]|uniref:rRNA adenine N(6)-methyltransferase n=1 Tax=Camelus dromedarius TaxID=9838 RepID=A0A5N4CIQ8_CAMDR|nr:Dimethyladenosine transferase 2; mitochondrial [Camelus dromedarius]